MHTTVQLSDADLLANASLIAQAIAAHPVALLFTSSTIDALSAMATSEAAIFTAAERRLLRRALAAIDAAEIVASREERP